MPMRRYQLFIHVDDDRSGKIIYGESAEMVRGELRLGKQKLPEAELESAWAVI